MAEARSPLSKILDLVVYAPLGMVVTLIEDIPGLAEKGRSRITPPVDGARLIGRFAVNEGMRRAGLSADTPARRSPTRAAEPAPRRPGATDGPRDVFASPSRDDVSRAPTRPAAEAPLLHAVEEPILSEGAPVVRPSPVAARAVQADDLAIPGYDSLSASHVIQRLAGLTPSELAAVGDYEVATRGRRTVLARVAQLQSR